MLRLRQPDGGDSIRCASMTLLELHYTYAKRGESECSYVQRDSTDCQTALRVGAPRTSLPTGHSFRKPRGLIARVLL